MKATTENSGFVHGANVGADTLPREAANGGLKHLFLLAEDAERRSGARLGFGDGRHGRHSHGPGEN